MTTCAVCGNDYDKAFKVTDFKGDEYTFDSFECAIHKLAPSCSQCGMKVIGHGVEAEDDIYCCAHCAQTAGKSGLRDRYEKSSNATLM